MYNVKIKSSFALSNSLLTCLFFSRFPPPGLFSTKVVPHDPSISAFTVPASRSSAFNRVSAIQNPATSRRNVVFKEEQGATRMVWHGPSSNEQVYRMAQITSQQPANGSNSIIQIPVSYTHLTLPTIYSV